MAEGGFCLSCKIMERILETSFDVLADFGLKSHNLAIRSHSVPGSTSSASATNCFSAFLIMESDREKDFSKQDATFSFYSCSRGD